MPGRGAPGTGAPGTAAGLASRATMSARGGTTGRAAGCPAKFGLAGGRNGIPLPSGLPAGCPVAGAVPGAGAPGPDRASGRVGMAGTAPGPGAPGVVMIAGGIAGDGAPSPGVDLGRSARPGGSGCRGPDKICPGFGAGGAGREGITGPLFAGLPGPAEGCPLASGGRSGNAGRTGAEWSPAAGAGSLGASSMMGVGSLFAIELGAGRTASGAMAGGFAAASGSRPSPTGSAGSPNTPDATRCRICSATSSSSELECVFLSVTPSSGSRSRMMFGLTSSSRASSLMRILLITKTPKPPTSGPGNSINNPFLWTSSAFLNSLGLFR